MRSRYVAAGQQHSIAQHDSGEGGQCLFAGCALLLLYSNCRCVLRALQLRRLRGVWRWKCLTQHQQHLRKIMHSK
jgi:hypothetical protein